MKQLLEKRSIRAIGVVGAGNMGPEIALFFARSLGRFGVRVTVVDPDGEALRRGRERLEKKLQKEVEAGSLKAEAAAAILGALDFTADLGKLAGAGLVIEAMPEDLPAKRQLFARVEGICPAGAILASATAHLEPGEIFSGVGDKRRTLVLNFHHPLERNLLVEVVPHAETEPALVDDLLRLLELLGRVPLPVKSRYGHALGPIVAGLVQAAAQIVEGGQATVKQVDAVARKALRFGAGPLAALNQPGAGATVLQGLPGMRQRLGPWFAVPAVLEKKVQAGEPWEAAAREEKVEVPPELFQAVAKRLQGVYFGLVTEVLDTGLLPLADLELAVETALGGAPFARMNELGLAESLARVREFAAASLGFAVPVVLERQAQSGEPWEIPVVVRRDVDGVAVVTIRRPRVLNALNAEVIRQLGETFLVVGEDPQVRAAVLTGYGTRAFVAGADITELAALPGEAEAEDLSLTGQEVLEIIENLGKPVVCAMNGLAFGGGNELAMACHARLAPKGTRVLAGQPEPKLGLIPGYGGTQRLPRWVGVEKAWPLLRTGEPVSSAQALEMGLIRAEVEGDLLEAALDLARQAAAGEAELSPIPRGRIKVPKALPEVDLGHLSRKIDEILQEAVLGGAKRSLEEGLELETRLFGRCFTTRDGRIGLENFLKNGPRAQAEFVHE